MRLGWLLLIAGLLASCKGISAADSSDDAKEWQGTWKMISCTYDGEPQKGEMEWIVKGGQYTIRVNGVSQQDPNMITLDASNKHIDVFHHETPPGTYGGKLKGIYEINGDSLTVCYDLTAERYPKSLDAPRGSRQVLYKFHRE